MVCTTETYKNAYDEKYHLVFKAFGISAYIERLNNHAYSKYDINENVCKKTALFK